MDRVAKGIEVANELLPTIKRKFKKAYRIAEEVANEIEKELGKKVPEEEKGYLAIHIQRLLPN
ncbi:transcriptional antiterminator [Caldanaerobacter subterraneus subsp. tengcongensis MB4]|nr:transcriptional antiterminator [Caldanaerobacter subterraneus subsp. tengcongensis MB4]